MKANFIGKNISSFDQLKNPGDIGIGADNYHQSLLVNCPICKRTHIVPIVANRPPHSWDWNESTLTLQPSFKTTFGDGKICHWNLTKGVFVAHADSTAAIP